MLRISLARIEHSISRPSATLPKSLAASFSSYRSIPSQQGDQRCRLSHRQLLTLITRGQGTRSFSDNSDGDKQKKKDLRETINKLKGDKSNTRTDESTSADTSSTANNEHLDKFTSVASSFMASISETWNDLIASGEAKDINKKIGTPSDSEQPNYANDDEAADKYEEYKGSKDIMLVDPEEHLSAWERMEKRLRDAPIIADILERSGKVYEKSGAQERVQHTQQKIKHLKEDAEEAWETSQNPWVYRASSVYDTLTAESEFAAATRQLQTLDPDFTMENWKRDVMEHTLPNVMKLFLEGRVQELKPWLGEAVYNRLAAESRARKSEGVQMDTNVLAIMNGEILACEMAGSTNVDKGDDPIILLHFMCQQIHCVRKKVKDEQKSNSEDADGESEGDKDESDEKTYMDRELGEIVEGSEDDIRANSYVVAFQREYDEEQMALNWKIVDLRFNGAIAYL
jgi:mitochondrial import inner membrane translocase subunit TIM44